MLRRKGNRASKRSVVDEAPRNLSPSACSSSSNSSNLEKSAHKRRKTTPAWQKNINTFFSQTPKPSSTTISEETPSIEIDEPEVATDSSNDKYLSAALPEKEVGSARGKINTVFSRGAKPLSAGTSEESLSTEIDEPEGDADSSIHKFLSAALQEKEEARSAPVNINTFSSRKPKQSSTATIEEASSIEIEIDEPEGASGSSNDKYLSVALPEQEEASSTQANINTFFSQVPKPSSTATSEETSFIEIEIDEPEDATGSSNDKYLSIALPEQEDASSAQATINTFFSRMPKQSSTIASEETSSIEVQIDEPEGATDSSNDKFLSAALPEQKEEASSAQANINTFFSRMPKQSSTDTSEETSSIEVEIDEPEGATDSSNDEFLSAAHPKQEEEAGSARANTFFSRVPKPSSIDTSEESSSIEIDEPEGSTESSNDTFFSATLSEQEEEAVSARAQSPKIEDQKSLELLKMILP